MKVHSMSGKCSKSNECLTEKFHTAPDSKKKFSVEQMSRDMLDHMSRVSLKHQKVQ